MKHIQSFSLFEAQTSVLTTDQEEFLNECTDGTWSVNPTTGLVDVKGDFDCSSKRLKSLSGISFGHVSGYFFCSNNQLTSLKGAPQTVSGTFFCTDNKLTSLKRAPQTVGGSFYCGENQLTSLEGAPQTVSEDFWCHQNRLTSLEGAPQTVGGSFNCMDNRLTSLAGAPQTVDVDFNCFHNNLKSLEGAPQKVGRNFKCNGFQLDPGKWNMEGWLEVLNTGTPAAQKLILTLPWLQPNWWNSELQRDPGKTVHLLATVWNDMTKNMQSAIKIPKGYEDDFELFSGFDELGLF
jgi:hypothetical protein